MNSKILYFFYAVSLLTIFSCTKKKTYTEEVVEFRNTLSKEDTIQMLKLSDGCMDLLKAKKIDNAIAMLYEYNDSTKEVKALSPESEKRIRKMFKIFPVLDYKRSYYSFQMEGLNDVRYDIKFAEEQNPAENGEAKTSIMFNPVKVDNTWYLCVKNAFQALDPMRQ